MIKKAIILAAGHGTRVLPATKAIPKEALPIVDKPAIQYIVEEVVNSGITDIALVISRGKEAIQNHFDRAPELEQALLNSGKTELYNEVVNIANLADITYIRQKETKGTGAAVLCARNFVGEAPFVVIYADDVIIGETPATKQLCAACEEYGVYLAATMKKQSDELVKKCSSLKVKPLRDNIYAVSDMNEKPKKEDFLSNFSIMGRCVLPPEIFPLLEAVTAGAGGEIQLTDAMKILARKSGALGVDFAGKRYDMGNKLGVLKANIETGLIHAEIGEEFRAYLKGLKL